MRLDFLKPVTPERLFDRYKLCIGVVSSSIDLCYDQIKTLADALIKISEAETLEELELHELPNLNEDIFASSNSKQAWMDHFSGEIAARKSFAEKWEIKWLDILDKLSVFEIKVSEYKRGAIKRNPITKEVKEALDEIFEIFEGEARQVLGALKFDELVERCKGEFDKQEIITTVEFILKKRGVKKERVDVLLERVGKLLEVD
jgi:hypothetical protein